MRCPSSEGYNDLLGRLFSKEVNSPAPSKRMSLLSPNPSRRKLMNIDDLYRDDTYSFISERADETNSKMSRRSLSKRNSMFESAEYNMRGENGSQSFGLH